jgi:hypothetical protein
MPSETLSETLADHIVSARSSGLHRFEVAAQFPSIDIPSADGGHVADAED